jgi:hypothetical protein
VCCGLAWLIRAGDVAYMYPENTDDAVAAMLKLLGMGEHDRLQIELTEEAKVQCGGGSVRAVCAASLVMYRIGSVCVDAGPSESGRACVRFRRLLCVAMSGGARGAPDGRARLL